MKKAIIAVCLMLFLSIAPAGQAATMTDLVGTWQISSSETLTVGGLGTEHGNSSGTCIIEADGDYTATLGSFEYSGTCSLDAKGKKLTWNLEYGVDDLKDLIEEWIYDWAFSEGIPIGPVTVELPSIVCKVIKINKATNKPISASLKVKGTASAMVEGRYVTKKVNYTSLISFINGPEN